MPALMPPREYLQRLIASWLAPVLPDYLPPSVPRQVTLSVTENPMRLKATPPALDADVASIELHYSMGDVGGVLSLTTDPVEFDVPTAGDLSYFTIAVGKNGVKSAPCPTATFPVSDLTPPAVPGNVTLEQVS